jgi:hypothetical protein
MRANRLCRAVRCYPKQLRRSEKGRLYAGRRTILRHISNAEAARSSFKTHALGLRRAQKRNDRPYRIEHHVTANVWIGVFDAIGAQNLPGDDRDESAAINLRDLISRAGARSATTGREILRIERRNGAVAKAEIRNRSRSHRRSSPK